jgi:hypothetical protein
VRLGDRGANVGLTPESSRINDNHVVRTIAVSTGKPSTPTPPGDYRTYAKIPRWWSTPFREWLPWALPFVGGIAFHELQDVPRTRRHMRPPIVHRRSVDVRLRDRRHAGEGDRQILMHVPA